MTARPSFARLASVQRSRSGRTSRRLVRPRLTSSTVPASLGAVGLLAGVTDQGLGLGGVGKD